MLELIVLGLPTASFIAGRFITRSETVVAVCVLLSVVFLLVVAPATASQDDADALRSLFGMFVAVPVIIAVVIGVLLGHAAKEKRRRAGPD